MTEKKKIEKTESSLAEVVAVLLLWFDLAKILILAGFVLGLIAIFVPSTLPLWEGACAMVGFGSFIAFFRGV